MGQTTDAISLNTQLWFLNSAHQMHESSNTELTGYKSQASAPWFPRDREVWDANRKSYLLTEVFALLSKSLVIN